MDKLKHWIDGCAALAACSGFATAMGWIPVVLGVIASLMSIAWYSVRFYEHFKGKK